MYSIVSSPTNSSPILKDGICLPGGCIASCCRWLHHQYSREAFSQAVMCPPAKKEALAARRKGKLFLLFLMGGMILAISYTRGTSSSLTREYLPVMVWTNLATWGRSLLMYNFLIRLYPLLFTLYPLPFTLYIYY